MMGFFVNELANDISSVQRGQAHWEVRDQVSLLSRLI